MLMSVQYNVHIRLHGIININYIFVIRGLGVSYINNCIEALDSG